MRTLFADSFFYIALLSPRDQMHSRARDAALAANVEVVTTEFVMFEVADGYCSPHGRQSAVPLIDSIYQDPATRVISASETLAARAFALYRARPDKAWSLTDCTSFVVMEDMGIAEALTGDVHFEQAGFRALFRA